MQKQVRSPLGFLNVLVALLSAYVLCAMVVDLFFDLPPEVSRVLEYIDNITCFIFAIDFIVRFREAENKLSFMKWGWIDLLSCIPTIDILRWGRLLRLLRLLRLVRALRTTNRVISTMFADRKQGTFTSIVAIAILTIIFSSIAILEFENVPEGHIKTAEDALWWAYTTITTVGYGDRYPVTTGGRMVAVALMTVGVGIFGTFTAYVASWFVEGKRTSSQTK